MLRKKSKAKWLFVLWAMLSMVAWVAVAQQPRRIDDSALKNAGKRGNEWLTYGSTPGETRYSPLKHIDTTNVSRLGLAWTYEAGQGGGSQEATPLVWNGTIYGITNWSIVFAVDARTGTEKWRYDPQVNQAVTRPKVCCGIVNRGLAIYQGKIIAPALDGRLIALDAVDGRVLWTAQVSSIEENYTITMAPRIAKGKVIIGVSGAEYPVRGYFAAYDANTGKFAWRFYTVPGDPSKPFENAAMKKAAETWEGEWWKLGGGGTVWDGMAYDPDANLIYVGTGNGGPWPEELRQSKGKDNLYVCSILAVNPDNGQLKWHYQPVPGDSWDFDSVQQLLLADVRIDGRNRKVLMQANKNGFYYVLDRITGAFISAGPFATVTWAKGIDPETGRPIENPEARYGADPITLAPGPGGAHNWSPMSFNAATGLVYIPASSSSTFTFSIDQNFTYKPGQQNLGITFGGRGGGGGGAGAGAPAAAPPAASSAPARTPRPTPPAIGPTVTPEAGQRGGYLIAWDPVTQKERWRAPGGGGIGGGTVTTAGNLVIQVIPDGRLVAYSADKGEKLLDVQTGLRGGMGPPITYELDGKQYITLMGGTGVLPPRGGFGAGPDVDNAAGRGGQREAAPAPPAPPPVMPKLLTFVLDGKAPLPVSTSQ